MKELYREFVSEEPRQFKFKIGHKVASSLSGFVAGVIAGSIVWIGAILLSKLFS